MAYQLKKRGEFPPGIPVILEQPNLSFPPSVRLKRGDRKKPPHLQVSREGHVDLLSVGGHPVQKKGVVQRAVPDSLKAVESSGKK